MAAGEAHGDLVRREDATLELGELGGQGVPALVPVGEKPLQELVEAHASHLVRHCGRTREVRGEAR